MRQDKKSELYFEFHGDKSKRGTPIIYIRFFDDSFRLSEIQKQVLKEMCHGFFFYSKTRRMWGFTVRGNNEIDVYNYLLSGHAPSFLQGDADSDININLNESIYSNLEDFEVKFIDLKGRPLFYYENSNGVICININLSHWFFDRRDDIEMNFAKKIVLSLVMTQFEFTSQVVDSFFNKLFVVQDNLRYDYKRISK